MATLQRTSQPVRVPQYIQSLNALAESHGLVTSVKVGSRDDDPKTRLWVMWKGTCQQLQSVGLVAPYQLGHLIWPGQRKTRRAMITVPSSEPAWCHPLLKGEIEVADNQFEWNMNFGTADFSVDARGGLEVITYSDEVHLHGTAEALIASGIDKSRLPMGQRTSKSKWHNYQPVEQGLKWRCRRLPDSTHLYCFETEAAFQRRVSHQFPQTRPHSQAAIRHLRLVVDNTSRVEQS